MNTLQMRIQEKYFHSILVFASPILVIIIGHLAARFFYYLFNDWAWLGSSIVYWGSMILMIWLLGERQSLNRWFGKSQGSKWWILLALGMGLISFPLLLFPNLHVMKPIGLVLAWVLFAVVNSIGEEVYWRGFLLDETSHLPRAFGIIYSTILFTAIHPLMLGVFSKIQAFDPALPTALIPFWSIVMILALAFSLLYLKTNSLRLPILSHFLSDLGNLSIFLFMNIVTI